MGSEDQVQISHSIHRGARLLSLLVCFFMFIGAAGGVGLSKTGISAFVYPNPVLSQIPSRIHVEFKVSHVGDHPTFVCIFNASGDLMQKLNLQDAEVSKTDVIAYEMPLNADSFKPGVYTAVVDHVRTQFTVLK